MTTPRDDLDLCFAITPHEVAVIARVAARWGVTREELIEAAFAWTVADLERATAEKVAARSAVSAPRPAGRQGALPLGPIQAALW